MDEAAAGRRLRLAWVVAGPLGQLTGGYLYDARMVRELRGRGHAVRVVEVGERLGRVDLPAGARLARALAGGHWDAVVIDELAHPAMVAGVPLLRRAESRAPILAVVHHLRCSEPGPVFERAVSRAVERLALRGVDMAVCTSRTTAEGLRGVLPGRIRVGVVRPGRDLPLAEHDGFCPANGSSDGGVLTLPHPNGSMAQGEEGRLRILTVAHWTPRKAIVEMLRALALSPRGIGLDLVGDQDRDPAYASRVGVELRRPELAGRVQVHGRVTSDRLAELYRQSDALLLASTHEGYGMVLGEALSAGLPIVATRVGAVPEVVRDGREAELVAAGDVAALARALGRLAADPAERRRRAACARERARELPTWEQSGAAFAELVERLAGSGRGRPCAPGSARRGGRGRL